MTKELVSAVTGYQSWYYTRKKCCLMQAPSTSRESKTKSILPGCSRPASIQICPTL